MSEFSGETIHIENLRVECIIGVHPQERDQPQTLLISVSFPKDFSAATQSDALADTLDYSAMTEAIRVFAREGEFQLLETLARRLAEYLGNAYGLKRLRLRVNKPSAIADSDGPAVSLTWRRKTGEQP